MPKEPAGTGAGQSQASSARPVAVITSVTADSNHADRRAQRIARTSLTGSSSTVRSAAD
jgi:hypothetical protein